LAIRIVTPGDDRSVGLERQSVIEALRNSNQRRQTFGTYAVIVRD
jgi:hypothetical protein